MAYQFERIERMFDEIIALVNAGKFAEAKNKFENYKSSEKKVLSALKALNEGLGGLIKSDAEVERNLLTITGKNVKLTNVREMKQKVEDVKERLRNVEVLFNNLGKEINDMNDDFL
jgi:hypothetical protein